VESTEVMWTPVALSNGEMNPENYALGFRVGQDDVGRFVHHGGKSVGGYSFLLIYPDLDLVVAFSTNVTPSENSFDRLQQAQKIARLFIN
jgi:serine beta-lactamase-like protein LACTB